MATSDIADSEEELLDYFSDCDDAVSVCMSDAGDLLDDDSLYESVNFQTVLKPSQRNPITAPKASHITPITGLDPSLLSTQPPPALKLTRTFPVKKIKTTHITSASAIVSKKQLPCHITSNQRSPIGAPGEKNISKRFEVSPIIPPNSRKATTNTTKRSKRMLPRVTSVAQDFVFTTSSKSPVVTSDSDESFDDYSRYCNARTYMYARDSEPPHSCSGLESHTSSDNSETNLVSMVSSSNDGSSFSFRAEETEMNSSLKRQCRSLTSSPLVCSTSSASYPRNQFSPPQDSSPVDLTADRMMDCSESNASTQLGMYRDGATRRKSKIVKLNQPKVFRYVPDNLPEVELPNLASKKRAARKRGNTFPGDDCPDLLLETKRHVREGDLRSMLTSRRTNKTFVFNDEGSSPAEPRNITRTICRDRSSPMKQDLQPSQEAHHSRPHSPIAAPTARVTQTLTSVSRRLDAHKQSPSVSPARSLDSGLATVPSTGLQERTCTACMSNERRLQEWHSSNATVHSSSQKSTATQTNKSSAPPSNFFKTAVDSLKNVPPAASEPKPSSSSQCQPSIFRQCVSIFAQRPNLMGRSSPGLNQFSLSHLDGPTGRSFALDHL